MAPAVNPTDREQIRAAVAARYAGLAQAAQAGHAVTDSTRARSRRAREAAIVISRTHQRPAGVSLATDIGLRRIVLGIKRVEVLIEARTRSRPGYKWRSGPIAEQPPS